MSTSVQWDTAAFQQGLERRIADLKLETAADLMRLGQRAVRAMQQRCPVDTGRMRASIGVTAGSDARGPYVDIGPAVEYAIHVEFGTRFRKATPFVRPGLDEAISQGLR